METNAFAEKNTTGVHTNRSPVRTGFTGFLLAGVLALSCSSPSTCASRAELQARITELQSQKNELSDAVSKLGDQYQLTNAGKLALFIVGVTTSSIGQTVDIPITLLPGPEPVSSLQMDLVIPSSFTFVAITPGPASIQAQKNVQGNMTGGVFRFVVFGINQNTIPAGGVAILRLRSAGTVPRGDNLIRAANPSASDGDGNAVPISATSGLVGIL